MTIHRNERTKGSFVTVDKGFIQDDKLSAKAKGLMLYFLSKPDHWQFYESEIAKEMKDGKDSIKSGIQELIDNGYLMREINKDGQARFTGYQYQIYESPIAGFPQRKNRSGKSVNGKTDNGKSATSNNNYINNKYNNNNIYNVVSDENDDFHSFSNSEIILKHWNQKQIIVHQKLRVGLEQRINKVLKDYSVDELKRIIDNYAKVYQNEEYYFNSKYTLMNLLRDKDLDQFSDEAEPLNKFRRDSDDRGEEYDPIGNIVEYTGY